MSKRIRRMYVWKSKNKNKPLSIDGCFRTRTLHVSGFIYFCVRVLLASCFWEFYIVLREGYFFLKIDGRTLQLNRSLQKGDVFVLPEEFFLILSWVRWEDSEERTGKWKGVHVQRTAEEMNDKECASHFRSCRPRNPQEEAALPLFPLSIRSSFWIQ